MPSLYFLWHTMMYWLKCYNPDMTKEKSVLVGSSSLGVFSTIQLIVTIAFVCSYYIPTYLSADPFTSVLLLLITGSAIFLLQLLNTLLFLTYKMSKRRFPDTLTIILFGTSTFTFVLILLVWMFAPGG